MAKTDRRDEGTETNALDLDRERCERYPGFEDRTGVAPRTQVIGDPSKEFRS